MSTLNKILRSASLVSVGTAVGQLLAFGGSLVLVRIYSPEQMGLFTTIAAVAAALAPLASGRLSMATPLPKSDKSALTLANISLGMSGSVGIVIALSMLLATSVFNLENAWWWGLPAIIVSLTVFGCANQLAVRFEMYWGLAVRGVLYPLIMIGTQIIVGLVHFGAPGLLLGMVVGHVVTALTIWLPMRRKVESSSDARKSWRRVLYEFRSFPMVLGPSGSINGLASQLPQIGITVLFGLAIGGQFGMMMKILAVPVALIGQSIGYVYQGEIARIRRDGQLSVVRIYDRLSIRISIFATLMTGVVILFGEPLFSWLLGETWRQSGEFATLFAVSTGMQLVSAPLSQTLVVSGRVGLQLMIDLIRASSLVLSFALLEILAVDVARAVLVIGLVSAGGYVCMWWLNRCAATNMRPPIDGDALGSTGSSESRV